MAFSTKRVARNSARSGGKKFFTSPRGVAKTGGKSVITSKTLKDLFNTGVIAVTGHAANPGGRTPRTEACSHLMA